MLHRLFDAGNTAIVIENNLDAIRSADHILDPAPEGGAETEARKHPSRSSDEGGKFRSSSIGSKAWATDDFGWRRVVECPRKKLMVDG